MFSVNLSLILDFFHFIAFIFHLVPAPGAPGGARLGRGGLSMSLPVPAPAMRPWAFGSRPRDARAPSGAKSQKGPLARVRALAFGSSGNSGPSEHHLH